MKTEKKLADTLYAKLAGFSFDHDIHLDDGTILIPGGGRIRKREIARAISLGKVSLLVQLLIADPAQIGRMGTKRVRDGLNDLAQSQQKDGAHLARALSELLRVSATEVGKRSRKKGQQRSFM